MSRRRRDLRPAGQLLSRAMKKAGGGPDPAVRPVREAWDAGVGDAVKAAAQPIRRARNGVVTVACSDASWAAELRARSDDLLALIDGALPADAVRVSGLRFVVSDRPPGGEPKREKPRTARPTEREIERGGDLVGDVQDPTLRAMLARAAAATVARERQNRKVPGNKRQ